MALNRRYDEWCFIWYNVETLYISSYQFYSFNINNREVNKMTIVFRFKDGFELPIECESFELTTNSITGKIMDYKITGIKDNKPLYMPLDDIVCIWRKIEN